MTLQNAKERLRTVKERIGTQEGWCSKELGRDGDNHGTTSLSSLYIFYNLFNYPNLKLILKL